MDCPRDGGRLIRDRLHHRVGTIEIHECTKCKGTFAPGSTVNELRRKSNLPHRGRPDLPGTEPGKHPCPECRSWLQPIFAEGVELDVCVECDGIWFDRGELVNLPPPPAQVGPMGRPYYPYGGGWYWGPRAYWGPADWLLLLLFFWWD